jgi:hypothetical protein
MKDSLRYVFASEIRYACLLIGLLEIVWSAVGIVPAEPQSKFATVLHEQDFGVVWLFIMLLVGILLTAGAILPWRSGRHIALFLSSLIWFSWFGIFIRELPWAPVVASMPIIGAMCVLLMYSDAKQKPRSRNGKTDENQ